MTERAVSMMSSNHSPRSASALLSGALAHLDVIQPPSLRGPVRDILRAGIEVCATSRSLLGKPIQYTLDLATAVMDAVEHEERTDEDGQRKKDR